MTPIPQKLTGSGKKVAAINQIIDKLRELEIIESPNIKPDRKPNGTSLRVVGIQPGGGESDNVWM